MEMPTIAQIRWWICSATGSACWCLRGIWEVPGQDLPEHAQKGGSVGKRARLFLLSGGASSASGLELAVRREGRKLAMGKDAVLLALVGGIICSVGMVSGESKPMDGTVTPHLVVPVAVEGVRVDGDLGAGEWGGASCIDLKVTTSGRAIVPMARTNVCVQFDSTYFYVSFQTPYRVEGQVKRAGIARDDEQIALSSDDVEVFLEPEASGSGPFFQICVNADNLVYDRWWPSEQAVEQIRRDGTPSDETLVEMAFLDGVRWDAKGLLTGVGRMRESWVVEMAIPFSDLFVAGAPRGEIWRGNFAAHSFWPEFSDWSTWADTGPLLFAPATFLGIRFTE